jgi:hypothetical protein
MDFWNHSFARNPVDRPGSPLPGRKGLEIGQSLFQALHWIMRWGPIDALGGVKEHAAPGL